MLSIQAYELANKVALGFIGAKHVPGAPPSLILAPVLSIPWSECFSCGIQGPSRASLQPDTRELRDRPRNGWKNREAGG